MEAERRGLLTAWAHLGVLWSFAVAQPLLDLLGDTPEFFVARGNTRGDILLLAFGLVLLPPAAMMLVELCLLRVRWLREAVHLAFVGLLVAVFILQLEKDLLPGVGAAVAIAVAVAVGAAGTLLYARRAETRTVLTVLSPAPALFLALFLLASPVSDLVLPRGEVSAGGARGTALRWWCWCSTSYRVDRCSTRADEWTRSDIRTSRSWPEARPGTATPRPWTSPPSGPYRPS